MKIKSFWILPNCSASWTQINYNLLRNVKYKIFQLYNFEFNLISCFQICRLCWCWAEGRMTFYILLYVSGKVTAAGWQYSVVVSSSQGRPTTGRISSPLTSLTSGIAELRLWGRGLTVSTSSVRPRPAPSSGATARSWSSTPASTRSTGWRRWTPGSPAWTVSSSVPALAGTSPCWAGWSDIIIELNGKFVQVFPPLRKHQIDILNDIETWCPAEEKVF